MIALLAVRLAGGDVAHWADVDSGTTLCGRQDGEGRERLVTLAPADPERAPAVRSYCAPCTRAAGRMPTPIVLDPQK